jgi:hypothetical protein
MGVSAIPGRCRLRDTKTKPAVVQRFMMYVFAQSPQSQKNLLGKEFMAKAPPSDCT